MGKRKAASPKIDPQPTETKSTTISLLPTHKPDIWYRLHALLYDFSNLASDSSSQKRLQCTTHELYLSEEEATVLRTALVAKAVTPASAPTATSSIEQQTVEDSVRSRLFTFFDKRKASGDARPCGPHDMLPVYSSVCGISRHTLKGSKFQSRLKRSGLGDRKKAESVGPDHSHRNGKK